MLEEVINQEISMKRNQLAGKIVKIIILFSLIAGFNGFNNNSQAVPNTVLSLELNTTVKPVDDQYGLNMQQTFREIGIDLVVNVLEWGTFVGAILARPPNYQLGISGFNFGRDPDLSKFYHSTSGLNIMGPWNDSYNDALLDAGLSTADPAERKIIYDEWQEYVMDELPCLPLTNPTTYIARKATIGNYYPQYGSFNPVITRADAGTTLVYGSSDDLITLNPVYAFDDNSLKAIDSCLDGLYSYDYDFNIVPHLAASNPIISEDGLNWTISLREDIFWQDGEQFTAEDVYFSVMAYTNPENPQIYGLLGDTSSKRADYWAGIYDTKNRIFTGNVTVLDPFTVQFLLPQTYATFQINSLMSKIIPEHLLNVTDSNLDGLISDENTWQNYSNGFNYIGTGAYYFTAYDWTAETQYMHRLRTDPTNPYWIGTPETDLNNIPFDLTWTDEDVYKIEQVYTRIPQIHSQIAEFEAGNLDFVDLFANPELIPVYEADPRFNVTSAPSYNYDLLHFNLEDPVFKADPVMGKALRKAIAYATNRVNMVEVIKDGRAVVCDNPLSPSNTCYNWDNPIIYRYDIETALTSMANAGYDPLPPGGEYYIPEDPWPPESPEYPDWSASDKESNLGAVFGVIGNIILISLKVSLITIVSIASVAGLVLCTVKIRIFILSRQIISERKKIAGISDFLSYCSLKISTLQYVSSTPENHSGGVNRHQILKKELSRIKNDIEDYEVVEYICYLIDQEYNSLIKEGISELDEALFTLLGEISYLEKEISTKKI